MPRDPIVLKKVYVHNLKGVDLTLEPGQLIVFTGVSGSGKSSLAFDTIYAEGQRRYIESLSHHARRFLNDLPKPEAESITGIAPTIAIEQKFAGKTPRSTVGTMTGIYDYLRVLFARIAIPYCPVSQEKVAAQSREKILATLAHLPEGMKIYILSPYAREKKAEFKEDFQELMRKGFMRLRIDGKIHELTGQERLDASTAHNIDLVIDRLVVSPDSQSRIAESASAALDQGKGFFSIYNPDTEEETLFSQFAYSPKSGLSYGPLEPQDFSFNHPAGMCPTCHGLGLTQEYDLSKIIDPNLSISQDCCSIASSYQTVRYGNIYRALARHYKFDIDAPWKDLSDAARRIFLYGTEQKWTRVTFTHPEKRTRWVEFVHWRGVIHEARERLIAAKSDAYRKKMGERMIESVCPACNGARIKPYPAAARLGNLTIADITRLTLQEALSFFENLKLEALEQHIADELLKEIRERLGFLLRVGVQYLSLERTAPTLSGGESQRVRLASHIGSGLVGAIYVLDEPSIGLHPSDHHKLIETLLRLRNLGNTVLIVEHDLDTMLAADSIVDVGPHAGVNGGRILAQGSVQDLIRTPESITGAYLSGKSKIPIPEKRRSVGKSQIKIIGAQHHNLKNIDVAIPLLGLICVTGVSGSGKSSLISDCLAPALSNRLHRANLPVGAHKTIEGLEHLDKVIDIDQSPIGRTPRSNPATYIKLFDNIRDLFTELPESKLRGFHSGHFSFNVKEGSCSYCSGMGSVRVDMDFMEDAYIECPQCLGRRFDPEILAIRFKGKNIHDILEQSVDASMELFENFPTIRRKLEVLQKVGLGYLHLGQSSTTLSGGEAQRIKLAKELVRPSTTKTLYILDEPTTGLHFYDIERLIRVLQELIDKGSTVLIIEHNMDIVKVADWVIDLGPNAGIDGGRLIGQGTPEAIAKLKTPTGIALKTALKPQLLKPAAPSIPIQPPCETIEIKNASQNNLKNISLSIPRGKMTVFAGPSGSGKSSLAFETLYAEGQRRYAETLSGYARQAIKQMPKPKVDEIQGLSPAIALEQKTGGLNPRSTIGTITEIYDYLRILYAHLGTAYCPETGLVIRQISKETVAERVYALPQGEKIQILAPLPLPRKESFEEMTQRLSSEGYLRIRLNKTVYRLDEPIPFKKHLKNELELVIDRLVVDPESKERLYESIEKAVQRSNGIVIVAREKQDLFFNLSFAVEKTGKSYPSLTAQTFSFNAEAGMCPDCLGLGILYGAHLDDHRSIMRQSILTILERFFYDQGSSQAMDHASQIFKKIGLDPTAPLKLLSIEHLSVILNGSDETITTRSHLQLRWIGLHPMLARLARFAKTEIRQSLLPWLTSSTCASCDGTRLNPLARNVKINRATLPDLVRMNIQKASDFIEKIIVPDNKKELLAETMSQIKKSLAFLIEIGLHYLSLDRSAPTLSGGELQRIRLARQLGSGLTSCLYVLDEPTIGLHPQNCSLLLSALQKLQSLGNTIVLVEHDPQILRSADYLFDFGPHAGREGGRITAHGTIDKILDDPHSLTGAYLSGRKKIPYPKKRRPFAPDVRIENASLHNLKNISVVFPKAAITCLTGVSGSGKSTLIRQLLRPAAEFAAGRSKKLEPFEYLGAHFHGLTAFEKVLTIDQSPIGQTARADVSTYTEIQPLIRGYFAQLPQAKAKGLQPRHFSPNHFRGMCRTCWGMGYRTVDLQFLPSVRVPCDSCKGSRLNPISLEIRYKEKHFGQILEMTVSDALIFFSAIPRIAKRLQTLIDVGLGYLQLGQEVASLSGGEAQRLRLSRELAKREMGTTLYLIDEPSVGLHSEDIVKLLAIFHRLADKKNTLVLIEHHLDIIANADYVIDLGPEAGDAGGRVVATGTPEEIIRVKKSYTGRYLADILK
ncbi:MAG: uvrA-A [Parachlamydiales bacterium]|nr:uvrA-A [Parachlamydiales bacterium]